MFWIRCRHQSVPTTACFANFNWYKSKLFSVHYHFLNCMKTWKCLKMDEQKGMLTLLLMKKKIVWCIRPAIRISGSFGWIKWTEQNLSTEPAFSFLKKYYNLLK